MNRYIPRGVYPRRKMRLRQRHKNPHRSQQKIPEQSGNPQKPRLVICYERRHKSRNHTPQESKVSCSGRCTDHAGSQYRNDDPRNQFHSLVLCSQYPFEISSTAMTAIQRFFPLNDRFLNDTTKTSYSSIRFASQSSLLP